MGKKNNRTGKASHGTRTEDIDRSAYWKHGKSSGNAGLSAARRERKRKQRRMRKIINEAN
jgi:hypothetical protein